MLQIGKQMIDKDCPWGLIFGGEWFFLPFLNKVQQGGETYYQVRISPCQQTFGAPPAHNLTQLYIAVHLGAHLDSYKEFYEPLKPRIRALYEPQRQDPRRKQPTSTQKQKRQPGSAQQMPLRRSPRFQQKALQQKVWVLLGVLFHTANLFNHRLVPYRGCCQSCQTERFTRRTWTLWRKDPKRKNNRLSYFCLRNWGQAARELFVKEHCAARMNVSPVL